MLTSAWRSEAESESIVRGSQRQLVVNRRPR